MISLIQVSERVRNVGKDLIQGYAQKGKVETGINGPYDDQETEVRNLSHLIVIASIECLKYNQAFYKPLVQEMGEYLLSFKEQNGLYKMRNKPGKDECNGTIGHAWLIEGLLYAYKTTGDKKFLNESESLLNKHEFNYKVGLWGRPLMGKGDNAIDYTFNHELWYASTLAEFLKYSDNKIFKKELDCFLKKLHTTITINKSGRIAHSIYKRSQLSGSIKYKIARMRDLIMEVMSRPNMGYKENGYHLFNLMALARLYAANANSTFFKSRKFIKALSYISKDYFIASLQTSAIEMDCNSYGDTLTDVEKQINIYGYPYNVPGFEAMYCSSIFKEQISKETAVKLLQKQMDLTWDENANRFGKNCHDKVTINYRVYEFYRYLEL